MLFKKQVKLIPTPFSILNIIMLEGYILLWLKFFTGNNCRVYTLLLIKQPNDHIAGLF